VFGDPLTLAQQIEARALKSNFAALDRFGEAALKEHGRERLAKLSHVAMVYQNQSDTPRFHAWNDRLAAAARADNDPRYIAVAELNDMAAKGSDGDYSADPTLKTIAATSPDWYVRVLAMVYLSYDEASHKSGEVIRRMSDAEALVPDNDPDAGRARALIWETKGLALKELHDTTGATAAFQNALALSARSGYPEPDFDTVFNLARLAISNGNEPLARALQRIHHSLSVRSDLGGLKLWDASLCAQLNVQFASPRTALQCLNDVPANIRPQDLLTTGILSARAISEARAGDVVRARSDLALLKKLKADGLSGTDPLESETFALIEAEILAAQGRSADAVKLLRTYSRDAVVHQSRHFDSGIHQVTSLMGDELGTLRQNAKLEEDSVNVHRLMTAAALVVLAAAVAIAIYLLLLSRKLRSATERAAQASKAKSDFLANMSHEIRTPLNGVIGMADIMALDTLSTRQKGRLDVIRESGQALLSVINAILDISKIESGALKLERIAFDIRTLMNASFASFHVLAQAKGLVLKVEFTGEIADGYMGDPVRIRQIVDNILSNALKFTQQGGVDVAVIGGPGGISIAVRDTGVGMSEGALARIFSKFEQADNSITRSFGGTGLGLSIARQLAEAMGGSITVASTLGAGSTFTIALPLAPALAPPVASEPDVTGPPIVTGLRILVAEDNKTNQIVLRAILAQLDCQLEIVENGEAAVRRAAAQPWDVILMDVQMPVMNGLDAARTIRAAEAAQGERRTPILALTASAMDHQVQQCLAAGMDGHLSKPIDARRLLALIARASSPPEVERLAS